ncbi:MAG: hypothetical protein AB1938_24600 [Myxococcota bacterium]
MRALASRFGKWSSPVLMIRPFALGALLGVVLSFASCGGPAPKECSSATCTGCCDAAGECKPGNDLLACGSGGFLCVTCGSSQVCTLGACFTPGTGGGGATGGGMGGGATGGGVGGGATGGGVGGGATGGGVGGGATGGGVGGGATGGGVGGGATGGGVGGGATGGGVGGGATGGGVGGGATGGGVGGGIGGGGGTGGGAGGGFGGGGGACQVRATFAEVDTTGTFFPGGFVVGEARSGTSGTYEAVMGAAIMFNGGMAPGMGDLSLPTNQNPQTARYLSAFGQGCTNGSTGTTCATTYVGVSGIVSLSGVLGGQDAGSVNVTLSNIRYQFQNDAGQPDFSGPCIILQSESFNAIWP